MIFFYISLVDYSLEFDTSTEDVCYLYRKGFDEEFLLPFFF